MFLTELIREFLFDCKVRELSDLTVHNYEKQLQKFRHFVRENVNGKPHGVIKRISRPEKSG